MSGDATIDNTRALTVSANVIDNANLASGTFANIRGIGEQIGQLIMGTNWIIGVTFVRSDATRPSLSGVMRFARSDEIGWRNEANDDYLMLTVNGTDNLVFESDPVLLTGATQTLTSKTFSNATVFSAAPTLNAGTKVPFSADTTNAGRNVGSFGRDA